MTTLKTTAFRRFTATVAATATALALMTIAAVPAHADRSSDDFAKALAAVAAIAIIGSALNDNDERQPARATVQHRPQVDATPRGYRREYAEPQYQTRHQPQYKPHHQSRATVLPGRCAVEVRGRYTSGVAYTERCLRRAGVDERLPRRCEVSIRRKGRDATAYDQDCLLNSGFRTQGRGRR